MIRRIELDAYQMRLIGQSFSVFILIVKYYCFHFFPKKILLKLFFYTKYSDKIKDNTDTACTREKALNFDFSFPH